MKSKVCFYALILGLVVITTASMAQTNGNTTGYPVMTKSYLDVQGSPFLTDYHNSGNVILADGTLYNNMQLKYNQVDDVLYFKRDEAEFTFAKPVTEFTITYSNDGRVITKRFKNGYPVMIGSTTKSFYEILADGKTQLLKRTLKKIVEAKPYNSATTIQSVNEDLKYYLFKAGVLTPVKKDKKSILNAIGDQQAELESFIKNNTINLKTDEGIARLVNYYNSL